MTFARYIKHFNNPYILYSVEIFVQTKTGKFISIGGFNCATENEFLNATECCDYVLGSDNE